MSLLPVLALVREIRVKNRLDRCCCRARSRTWSDAISISARRRICMRAFSDAGWPRPRHTRCSLRDRSNTLVNEAAALYLRLKMDH